MTKKEITEEMKKRNIEGMRKRLLEETEQVFDSLRELLNSVDASPIDGETLYHRDEARKLLARAQRVRAVLNGLS